MTSRPTKSLLKTKEHQRLQEFTSLPVPPWRKWGPYVSERAWGTVREDYSPYGTAWDFFPHDLARSKAYRWGEDGLAGICDRYQILTFALALWNGRDPILKERLYGLVPGEANHGEDVKEYYFYLDSTPTHSYMKYLYKYPQSAFPYSKLIEENSRRRGRQQPEYELIDTGVFDDNRYFDVFVEYAKADPEDICIRIEVVQSRAGRRSHTCVAAALVSKHLELGIRARLRTDHSPRSNRQKFKSLEADDSDAEPLPNFSFEYRLGKRYLYADANGQELFTNNETNAPRVWGPDAQSSSPFVKDAFHRYVIGGEQCVNPAQVGTKACFHYAERNVPSGRLDRCPASLHQTKF